MTLRHLRIFIVVAECKNMSLAAEKLYITQPSVSQVIREMEEYYGCRLFERFPKGLSITPNGSRLLDYARYIIEAFDKMEVAMKNSGSRPRLLIGGSASVGASLLGEILVQFQKDIPKADVKVFIDNTSRIEGMIESGQLDAAIVEGSIRRENLAQLAISQDELVLVVSDKHPLFHTPAITVQQLNGLGIISREEGSAVRNQYEQALEERNIILQKKWCCTNTEAIKNAVRNGFGAAIISKTVVEKVWKDPHIRILPVKDLTIKRKIHIIYHKHKYLSPPLQHFINLSKERTSLEDGF